MGRPRDPLWAFLALGVALFVADRALLAWRAPEADRAREIVVSDEFVEGLRQQLRARSGREPSATDVEGAIAQYAREEALVREARGAGLDAGDAIVRRRLVQKLEFVVAGTAVVPEPTDAQLDAWIAEHADDLERPARTRLEHVFFARERRGENAEHDARQALASVASAADPATLGDLFLRGSALGPSSDVQLDAVMGVGFARSIAGLPQGEWSDPVASALGFHLVRVIAREPGAMPEHAALLERARRGWAEAERARLANAELDRLAAAYHVERTSEAER